MTSTDDKPHITVIIPCLNEEKTIGQVISQAREGMASLNIPFEVVVADNGSTDRSRIIAGDAGARVIAVKKRGYGAALRTGIQNARGSIVIFGDADLTYDFREAPALIQRLNQGDADLVIGTRLKGVVEPGAMPWWHHYIGTPALTYLINLLFGAKITDSNSGFRAFYAQKFKEWRICSDGMEICSEVIINCLAAGGRIAEVPITLHKDQRDRPPHLSTWRDGMRNLLIILARAAHGFTFIGLTMLLASLLVAIPSALFGRLTIGPFSLFEHHSLILAILVGFFGAQFIFYGLLLDSFSPRPLAINRFFLQLPEVVLLKLLSGLLIMTLGFIGFIFVRWVQHHFNNINYLLPSLTVLYGAVVLGTLGFGIFIVQIQRKSPGAMDSRG